jgi:hypothetical protein
MVPFTIKSRSQPRNRRTPAQQAASDRAFRVFRLRGLWCQAYLLTGERREQAQAAVDAEIALLGAEPHGQRMTAARRSDEVPS